MCRNQSGIKNGARRATRLVIVVLLGITMCAVTASAQLEIGENISMRMNGNLGFGYNGSSGNNGVGASNSRGLNGNASLTGYYFHPNFLSFDLHPYYERSQQSADSQIDARGTGAGGSLGFFGGSRFPGSITFGKNFSSSSEFRVADVASVLGNMSGQNFGIGWSALLPGLPQLHANYSTGSSASSVSGIEGENRSGSKNLTLNSSYRLVGFDLQGNFSNYQSNYSTPGILTPVASSNSGSGTSYGLTASHPMPLRGGLAMGWGHSSNQSSTGTNWSSDTYTATTSIMPWSRLSLNQSVTYATNLAGLVDPSISGGGSGVPLRFTSNSNSLFLGTGATLGLGHGLTLNGHLNHREQTIQGLDFADTQFGGTLNYNVRHPMLGFLYLGFGVVDSASKHGNEGAGIVANVNATKKLWHWDTSADFNYSQNVQTLLIIATTSSYNYGGSLRRKLNTDTSFGGTFRASHSGITGQEGSGSRSESYNGGFSYKQYSVSGSYSQSSGSAVFNSSGELTATPIGSLITDDFMLFNATSYAASVSTRLFRRVSLSGSYSKFTSKNAQGGFAVVNSGNRFTTRAEYRLRKFSIIGGFSRSMQSLSAATGKPRVVNSYSVRLSRWFNIF